MKSSTKGRSTKGRRYSNLPQKENSSGKSHTQTFAGCANLEAGWLRFFGLAK